MLNDRLYQRLLAVFHDVKVSNMGERLVWELVPGPFGSRTRIEIKHWGETYSVNCPFCHEFVGRPDRHHRLYISHAWYGEIRGRRLWWLVKCHNEDCFRRNPDNIGRLRAMLFYSRPEVAPIPEPTDSTPEPLKPVRLPRHIPTAALPDDHPAVRYLLNRGIDKELQVRYNIGYCYEQDPDYPTAHNRILFPIYMNHVLVSWQARSLGNALQKYYNCPGTKVSNILYGWDLISDDSYCILVEGIFDAIRVGPPALALFGKSISDAQARLLRRFKVVFYLPDSDVTKEEKQHYLSILRRYNIRCCPINCRSVKDPGEMTKEQIRILHEVAKERANGSYQEVALELCGS